MSLQNVLLLMDTSLGSKCYTFLIKMKTTFQKGAGDNFSVTAIFTENVLSLKRSPKHQHWQKRNLILFASFVPVKMNSGKIIASYRKSIMCSQPGQVHYRWSGRSARCPLCGAPGGKPIALVPHPKEESRPHDINGLMNNIRCNNRSP